MWMSWSSFVLANILSTRISEVGPHYSDDRVREFTTCQVEGGGYRMNRRIASIRLATLAREFWMTGYGVLQVDTGDQLMVACRPN